MLGNLLMDVNKPSLWKNGVRRGGWMVMVVVSRGGLLLSFSLSYVRVRPHTECYLN